MILNYYTPKSNDRELLDFVNDVTNIINNGRLGVASSAVVPVGGQGSTVGELRLYVNSADVRLYALTSGGWKMFQSQPDTQSGWGYITISGTPAYQTATLTFPRAFATAPYVLCTYIGVKTGTAPSLITDISGANTLRSAVAYTTTTTGCTIVIQNTAGGAMTSGHHECFAWIAIAT